MKSTLEVQVHELVDQVAGLTHHVRCGLELRGIGVDGRLGELPQNVRL